MEPDWDKLLGELYNKATSKGLWDYAGYEERTNFRDRYIPILKRHFEQFEKDLLANVKSVTGLECADCPMGLACLGCTFCSCSISRFKKSGTWIHVDGDTDDD